MCSALHPSINHSSKDMIQLLIHRESINYDKYIMISCTATEIMASKLEIITGCLQ